MNWDRIEGKWKQFKGMAHERWGRLTDEELDEIAGRRDALSGRIQELYGIAKDEAERQIRNWESSLKEDSSMRPKTQPHDDARPPQH